MRREFLEPVMQSAAQRKAGAAALARQPGAAGKLDVDSLWPSQDQWAAAEAAKCAPNAACSLEEEQAACGPCLAAWTAARTHALQRCNHQICTWLSPLSPGQLPLLTACSDHASCSACMAWQGTPEGAQEAALQAACRHGAQ